jgi:hypothetical protein
MGYLLLISARVAGRTMREQAEWAEHCVWVNTAMYAGKVILGGPIGDGQIHRALLLRERGRGKALDSGRSLDKVGCDPDGVPRALETYSQQRQTRPRPGGDRTAARPQLRGQSSVNDSTVRHRTWQEPQTLAPDTSYTKGPARAQHLSYL